MQFSSFKPVYLIILAVLLYYTVLWNICLYQEARYECKLSCESIPSEGKLICPRPQILLRQMLDLEFLPVLSIWI